MPGAAIEAALSGKDVAVVCSGDAGVYGMAGLILELLESYPAEQACRLETQVIPGITAACGGARRAWRSPDARFCCHLPERSAHPLGTDRSAAGLGGTGGFCDLPV